MITRVGVSALYAYFGPATGEQMVMEMIENICNIVLVKTKDTFVIRSVG
jgi:hypothetical protein